MIPTGFLHGCGYALRLVDPFGDLTIHRKIVGVAGGTNVEYYLAKRGKARYNPAC